VEAIQLRRFGDLRVELAIHRAFGMFREDRQSYQ